MAEVALGRLNTFNTYKKHNSKFLCPGFTSKQQIPDSDCALGMVKVEDCAFIMKCNALLTSFFSSLLAWPFSLTERRLLDCAVDDTTACLSSGHSVCPEYLRVPLLLPITSVHPIHVTIGAIC